jgi:hypothetical protein
LSRGFRDGCYHARRGHGRPACHAHSVHLVGALRLEAGQTPRRSACCCSARGQGSQPAWFERLCSATGTPVALAVIGERARRLEADMTSDGISGRAGTASMLPEADLRRFAPKPRANDGTGGNRP